MNKKDFVIKTAQMIASQFIFDPSKTVDTAEKLYEALKEKGYFEDCPHEYFWTNGETATCHDCKQIIDR